MKKIAVLGSSGSVGSQALEVIRENKHLFQVFSIAVHSNIFLLEKQVAEFNPEIITVFDENQAKILQSRIQRKVYHGIEGLIEAATHKDVDLVLMAMSGTLGIIPAYHAIEAGKDLAIANKEILVSAGELIMQKAREKNVRILPVDSEHNAIFQCLKNENKLAVKRLIITASGGPFLNVAKENLKHVTVADALKHPTYRMGKKISVDSSTGMNKTLEVIEAHYLFDIDYDKIEIVIHPQSLVHSMVEFIDGSILAQIYEPDMKIAIHQALSYPQTIPLKKSLFDFTKNSFFAFLEPDAERFQGFALAKTVLNIKKSLPCYMNSANEMLVERFLNEKIKWTEIMEKLNKLISLHQPKSMLNLDDILEVANQAKEEAKSI